jgi:hypothetical protein
MGEQPGAAPLLSSKIKMDQLSDGRQSMRTSFVKEQDLVAPELADHYPHLHQHDQTGGGGGEWICGPYWGQHVSMLEEMSGHLKSAIGVATALSVLMLLPAFLLGHLVWRKGRRAAHPSSTSSSSSATTPKNKTNKHRIDNDNKTQLFSSSVALLVSDQKMQVGVRLVYDGRSNITAYFLRVYI